MIRTKIIYPRSIYMYSFLKDGELNEEALKKEYDFIQSIIRQKIKGKTENDLYIGIDLDDVINGFINENKITREKLIDIKYRFDSENGASALIIWDD